MADLKAAGLLRKGQVLGRLMDNGDSDDDTEEEDIDSEDLLAEAWLDEDIPENEDAVTSDETDDGDHHA
jgi:hypothetical protein